MPTRRDAQSANDAHLLGAGYVYSLSKRTALYAHVARIDNKGAATFAIPGGVAVSGDPAAPNFFGGRKSTGYEAWHPSRLLNDVYAKVGPELTEQVRAFRSSPYERTLRHHGQTTRMVDPSRRSARAWLGCISQSYRLLVTPVDLPKKASLKPAKCT